MQIRQQDHSIDMFDGIIEIRRDYDNVIVMNGVEDNKLLKLNGTSSNSQNSANLRQHNSNLSSNLLWHARFGHINYDSLIIMKQKGVQDNFPHVMFIS